MCNGARSSGFLWSCLTRWLLVGVTLVLVGGLSRPALAESEEIEGLLQKGIELRRTGRDSEALEVFLQAEERDPRSVRVMLHVATAAQAAGKWVMADSYMKKVSRYSNDPYYRRYRDSISQVEQAIAQRVGRFIVAGGPPGSVVTMDGRRVGTLPMDSEVALEAGTYSVEVSKPGYYPLTRSVTVSGGSLSREVVNLNELPEEERLTVANGGSARVDSRNWYEQPWLTWTFAGVGVAAAATAGAAYAIREDRAKLWNDDSECLSTENPGLPRDEKCGGVRSDIDTAEVVTTISLAAAGTFAIAAVAHWWSLPDGNGSAPSDTSATLECGPGWGTLSCSGTF